MEVTVRVLIRILKMLYWVIKKLTKVQNKITFISRQGNSPSNDILLLGNALKQLDENLEIVNLCKMLKPTFFGMLSYSFHMLNQLYQLATSKAIVLDSYCIVASLLNHRESLSIFQMWHSMGSMKKFGYTAIGTSEGNTKKIAELMKMHSNYDFAFASATSYSLALAAGFNMDPQKIAIAPLPRLDLLTDKGYQLQKRGEILQKYPALAAKKNILYCPTFRKGTDSTRGRIDQLIHSVDCAKFNLIVKLHPLEESQIGSTDYFAPKDYSTFDLLSVADYVISDYSCIVYEASVLNIPLYFYAYDYEEYEVNRGLAIDYLNECPGVVSSDPKVILKAIESGGYDIQKLIEFQHKYIRPTKHAAKDMAQFILSETRRKEAAR